MSYSRGTFIEHGGGGRTVHENKVQALVNAPKCGDDMDTQKPSYEATGGAVSGFSLKVECLTVWTQKGTKQPMPTCLKRERSMRKGGKMAEKISEAVQHAHSLPEISIKDNQKPPERK